MRLVQGPARSIARLRATLAGFHGDWLLLPNLITYLRVGLIVLFSVVLGGDDRLALVLLLGVGVTDWADGFIARRWKLTSELGAFIDPLADRLVMIVVAVSFAGAQLIPAWLLVPLFLPELILG